MIPAFNASRLFSAAFCVAMFAMAGAGPVQAQAGNLPYQSGGVGISYGARQALLNARLLDSRPRNLVRGPDGSLLDVTRRGNQAFLRSPQTGAVLPGGGPGRGWATGLGTGLGWGGGSGAYSGALSYRYAPGGSAGSMMQWISMLDFSAGRSYGDGLSDAGGPIDLWIGANDLS